MSQIYTKGSEKTLVFSPRSGVFRQFNFGDDWTEMRLGLFASAVASTGPNDANTSETLVISNYSDYATFGIKNSGQALPGQTGSRFIGIRGATGSVISSPATGIGDPSGGWKAFTSYDTTENLTGSSIVGARIGQCDGTGGSSYCAFFAIKLEVNNRGLSSQTVTVSGSGTNTAVSGTDYSATALRTMMNNATYGTSATVAWNDGAVAYDLPDSVFVRMPLFSNCLRLSAVRAIRYLP
jgi:hypothetical protein